ncbi:MAG: hypothetical protein ACM3UU_02890 [Ignavibacteriales bacterium]
MSKEISGYFIYPTYPIYKCNKFNGNCKYEQEGKCLSKEECNEDTYKEVFEAKTTIDVRV